MIEDIPFCIIQPGKQKSRELAQAVIEGSGRRGFIQEGNIPVNRIPDITTPVFVGIHPTTVDTLYEAKRERRPFVTIDNGYFKPYKEGGYFRATSNALQWIASRRGSGVGRDYDCSVEGESRYAALDMPALKPWRTEDNGGHILIPLQSPAWLTMMRENPEWWLQSIITRIRAYTDREIVVRHKPLKGAPPQPPLEEHLDGAFAVVAMSSNVLLKAAMQGIPICSIGYCATSPLGVSTPDSLFVGSPHAKFRERESILHALAANQWTISEIASGKMWRDLQARYEPEFLQLS